MKKKYIFTLLILLLISLGALVFSTFLQDIDIAVLNPKGLIGSREKELLILVTLLMLIVVIPVCILTVYISWQYRASNKKAKYSPEWDNSHLAEAIWWGLPCIIIAILSVITWQSCHELDPFKPLKSDKKAVTIQVVALQWRWLFIYPEYNIATLNYIQIPEQTPINFEVTADAPMNSFWIPQLGGQIYAMPGMKTKLHLIADEPGTFKGLSANLSGTGFAGMKFTAKATSREEFDEWVSSVKKSPNILNVEEYNKMIPPNEDGSVKSYILKDPGLYDQIVMKYMMQMP